MTKVVIELLRKGPLLVGEVRGANAEVLRRIDKSDKSAPPIEQAVFKINLELLSDGSQVMLTIFLPSGTDAEEFAKNANVKRGDIIAVAIRKLEMQRGMRRAVCLVDGFVVLDETEAGELRCQFRLPIAMS